MGIVWVRVPLLGNLENPTETTELLTPSEQLPGYIFMFFPLSAWKFHPKWIQMVMDIMANPLKTIANATW